MIDSVSSCKQPLCPWGLFCRNDDFISYGAVDSPRTALQLCKTYMF